MTVNDYKETACVTAAEDMEVVVESELMQSPENDSAPHHDSEQLLGRVLAGTLLVSPTPVYNSQLADFCLREEYPRVFYPASAPVPHNNPISSRILPTSHL